MSVVSKSSKKRSCSYCGLELSANALYCPKCLVPNAPPSPRRRPGTLPLLLGVSLIFGSPCAWVISGQVRSRILQASLSQTVVHAASVPAPRAVDQAAALIQACGTPSRDISTAYNNPRPPIPFRVLDYNGSHLQFAFVPGGGAKIGDPPPYQWRLSGVLDSTTNQRVSLQEAANRMSCAAPLETLSDAHAGAASANNSSNSASLADPETASVNDGAQ